jgi:hypothetical protein
MERFPQAQTLALENSGHAGFIEEEAATLGAVTAFVTGETL